MQASTKAGKQPSMNQVLPSTVSPRLWLAAALIAVGVLAAAPAARGGLPDPVRFGVAIEAGDIHAVRAWLDEGLDPDFVADRVGTGLMIAAWEGNIPMLGLFFSRGADVNRVNDAGEQALMLAAWKGRIDAVRWLLDRGAHVNRQGLKWSALHYATFAGHEDVARLLLEHGADVKARSTNGSSVLMMAAREGRETLARLLLERGADPRTLNDRGEDALAWAMRYDNLRIARLVASPERFAEAARNGRTAYGPAVRSVSVPERIDALFREMRAAEAEGRLTDDLRKTYWAAVADLEKVPTPALTEAVREPQREAPPQALEITAKREEPGAESAMLIYERGLDEPLMRRTPETKPARTPKPKQQKPPAPQ